MIIGVVFSAIGLLLTAIGLYFTLRNIRYNKYKDQKTEEEKRQADSEKRISNVVDKYLNNEANHIVEGIPGIVRAGAASLCDENEIFKVIDRIISHGTKNPIGQYYDELKKENRLLSFIKKTSEYTPKVGTGTKSPEDIIKMLDEKSNR